MGLEDLAAVTVSPMRHHAQDYVAVVREVGVPRIRRHGRLGVVVDRLDLVVHRAHGTGEQLGSFSIYYP